MTKKKISLKKIIVAAFFGYIFYLAVGYASLYSRGVIELVNFAIHPDDIEKKWRFLPFVDKASWEILESKSPKAIQQGFIGFDLSMVASGVRVYPNELSAEQREKSRILTKLIYDKGVGLGVQFVGGSGCTAVQGAIINKNIEAARTILELGGAAATVANPNAKLKPCRQDAYTLAKERGFSLPLLNLK